MTIMKWPEVSKMPLCEHCGKHFYKGLNHRVKTIKEERKYLFCGKCCANLLVCLLNDRIIGEHILIQYKRV